MKVFAVKRDAEGVLQIPDNGPLDSQSPEAELTHSSLLFDVGLKDNEEK